VDASCEHGTSFSISIKEKNVLTIKTTASVLKGLRSTHLRSRPVRHSDSQTGKPAVRPDILEPHTGNILKNPL